LWHDTQESQNAWAFGIGRATRVLDWLPRKVSSERF